MTHRRRRRRPVWRRATDRHLGSWLARWWLTALTILAVSTGQPIPAAITGALAAAAWTTHHRTTKGHRPR